MTTTHYEIELCKDSDLGFWESVGSIDHEGIHSYAESAFDAWREKQSDPVPGRYRVIEHKSYGSSFVEFDLSTRLEWIVKRVERQAPATFPDGSRDGMTRSLDVVADALAAPGGES